MVHQNIQLCNGGKPLPACKRWIVHSKLEPAGGAGEVARLAETPRDGGITSAFGSRP